MGRRTKSDMEIARLMTLPLLLLLMSLISHVKSVQYLTHFCPNTTLYPSNSSYQSNLQNVLTSLSSFSSKRFGSSSSGTTEIVQGLYQCRGDCSFEVCKSCVYNATNDLLRRCPVEKTVVIWYDECLLRFSNETIFSVLSSLPQWIMVSSQQVGDSERTQFTSFLRTDLNQCATEAVNGEKSKFAVKERRTFSNFSFTTMIYAMTQCTDDLSADDCSQCLQPIVSQYLASIDISIGARITTPSCFFRYETYQFYNSTDVVAPKIPASVNASAPVAIPASPPQMTASVNPSSPAAIPGPPPKMPASGERGISKVKVLAIPIPIGVLCLLFCVACCCMVRAKCMRSLAKERETVESCRYDLATLQAATGDFSAENVVGRGGFGEVFKGTLNDGLEIAVKRLSKGSTQGAAEFKNEVNSLVHLQHRNLTTLLGYCVESEERILVYEFVPNKSLDCFLFDSEKRKLLDWSKRFCIIQGIAQGILYLHEESRLKIIHRDLKASNILLDSDLRPKISDFGISKIIGVDQSHITTDRVVGTYGYLSPEYAMHGQYSAKSDVYSFGVVVLEVVTGKRNNYFNMSDVYEGLIGYVWKHWTEQTTQEVVDTTLGEMYSMEEVQRCIHIGLLCVQENAMERPSMAYVVTMLNSYSMTLTMPEQPLFFHGSTQTSE